jgi:Reverse transcriptase (RNA-dependent DNA polymerase)
MQQKTQRQLDLGRDATGEARSDPSQETEAGAARPDIESRAAVGPSMEAVVERENLKKALAQVQRNKGAPGIDGMSVDALTPYLKEHWPTIRAQLLDGTYKPQPVRRVEIPKATGGTRLLGIPTVLDRFIQQAVMQVLQAEWDRTFSEHSFGFRPKRSAHQAVARAQEYIASGHNVVVDISQGPVFDATHGRAEPLASCQGTVVLPHGVARLLWLLRDSVSAARAGPMDQAPATRHRLEAVEARAHALCEAATPRRRSGPGGANRRQPTWPLAAQQQSGAQHRPAECFLRFARPRAFGTQACRLIRRTAVCGPACTVVWEGRSREALPYPDCVLM